MDEKQCRSQDLGQCGPQSLKLKNPLVYLCRQCIYLDKSVSMCLVDGTLGIVE